MNHNFSIKGTVSIDFLLLVFFIIQFPPQYPKDIVQPKKIRLTLYTITIDKLRVTLLLQI